MVEELHLSQIARIDLLHHLVLGLLVSLSIKHVVPHARHSGSGAGICSVF